MNTVSTPDVWALPCAPQPDPLERQIKECERSINYNQGEIYRAEQEIKELEDEIRELEKELTAPLAEAANRVLQVHTPSGRDFEALEAAAANIPLTPHQLCRLKTLAREFLFLCL
jgi:chromosome segregation ATPase